MKICPLCDEEFEDSVSLCPEDGVALQPKLPTAEERIGDLLSAKYRLNSILGKGGMGAVFDGEHIQLGRPVAVKMIHPGFLCPESSSRFQREAKIASSLNHPNVIQIYDFGEADDGSLYLVMERLDGRELKEEIVEKGGLPVGKALSLFEQICEGIAVAHGQNMLHRDLKPQNIMLVKDARGKDQAKILDFGLARSVETDRTALTQAGTVMGSPQYMSPEQVSGQELSQASDIYSLGLILYEMLAGKPAFVGKNASDIFRAHLTEMPPALQMEGLPEGLNDLIMKCLAKEPSERYTSAEELLHAIPVPTAGAASSATVVTPDKTVQKTPAAVVPVVPVVPDVDDMADTRKEGVVADAVSPTKKTTPSSSPKRLILGIVAAAMLLFLSLAGLGAFGAYRFFKANKYPTVAGDIGDDYDISPASSGLTEEGEEIAEEYAEIADDTVAEAEAALDAAEEEAEAAMDAAEDTTEDAAASLTMATDAEGEEVSTTWGTAGGREASSAVRPTSRPTPRPTPKAAPTEKPVVEVEDPPPAETPAETIVEEAPLPEYPKVYIEVSGEPFLASQLRKELTTQLKNVSFTISPSRAGAHLVVSASADPVTGQTKRAFGTHVNLVNFVVNISTEAVHLEEQAGDVIVEQITYDPMYAKTKAPYEAKRVTKGFGRSMLKYWESKME